MQRMAEDFPGLPRECPAFFRELAVNNDKLWFDAHKAEFDRHVLNPAKGLVLALGERLRTMAPGIHAEPAVNKSIFRIYRDTRFSRDKTPYKTHLGIWFWEGTGPRMECSGFYFQLDGEQIMLGAGLYMFPDRFLEVYRQAVIHPKTGPALARAIEKVTKTGPYEVGGQHYQKVPRGYDPGHKLASLLLNNGLWVGIREPLSDVIHSPELPEYLFRLYAPTLPVHEWLVALLAREK